MSLRRLENDGKPNYTSDDTTAPTYNLPGRDSVNPPDETESSLTDTPALAVAETSKVPTLTPNYSKRPSGKFKFSTVTSHSCGFC